MTSTHTFFIASRKLLRFCFQFQKPLLQPNLTVGSQDRHFAPIYEKHEKISTFLTTRTTELERIVNYYALTLPCK